MGKSQSTMNDNYGYPPILGNPHIIKQFNLTWTSLLDLLLVLSQKPFFKVRLWCLSITSGTPSPVRSPWSPRSLRHGPLRRPGGVGQVAQGATAPAGTATSRSAGQRLRGARRPKSHPPVHTKGAPFENIVFSREFPQKIGIV